MSKLTPFPYASNNTIVSKENEKAACDDMEAAQRDDSGTKLPPLPTKLITKYIIRYQTMATINPNSARVKNTLMNMD